MAATGNDARAPERRDAGLQRVLKIVVVMLGVLIVLGLAAIVVRVVQLASSPGLPSGPGQPTLALPDAAVVRSLSYSGPRFALHYTAPSGEGIAIFDVETGRMVSRVRIVPEGASK